MLQSWLENRHIFEIAYRILFHFSADCEFNHWQQSFNMALFSS